MDFIAAEDAYADIRASITHVERIAAATGFKAVNIAKVKKHLFEDDHLLDRYKTAAERAFKRAILNVELLRKLNFTEQDREMRRVRWDQVQEAKQAGLKLTSIKKEMELTKVTDEAYRRAADFAMEDILLPPLKGPNF